MIIQPVSDLRNYNSLLTQVKDGEPVILTKNGKGAYAIVSIDDIEETRKLRAYASLFSDLVKADDSGYMTEEEFFKRIN